MTDVAHDPIEALLARMESKQIRCPNCGSVDGNLMRPIWELHPVRLELDGRVMVGYGYDQVPIEDHVLKPRIYCHQCDRDYELPDHAVFDWSDDDVKCGCEQEAEERRIRNLLRYIDEGSPFCRHCKQVAYWVGPFPPETGGTWSHSRHAAEADQRKCAAPLKTYIVIDVPDFEAEADE